jgi:hypothetical protein
MASQRGSSACFFIGQAKSCVKILLKQDGSMGANSNWAGLA